MVIHRFSNGDELDRYNNAIVARLAGPRRIISTAPICGGISENLKYAFNFDCLTGVTDPTVMKAPTYAEHMALIAAELGLEPRLATGISTAASMNNVSIKTETYENTTVTAAVTGGIEINGGRAGDPACWHESAGIFTPTPGTINIMLFIDADLTPGALTRALVTCTEGKTAALQELMAPSRYSTGLATGSGTDGTIIVSNSASDVRLTEAGKHSKLGELIGTTVMAAVKEALFLQTGLCAKRQADVVARLERFGVSRTALQIAAARLGYSGLDFDEALDRIGKEPASAAIASLCAHLLDQVQWGLFRIQDVKPALRALFGRADEEDSIAGYPADMEALISEITENTVRIIMS